MVSEPSTDLFLHRNLITEKDFVNHLDSLEYPYVDINDALLGRGSALTLDDATAASFKAALIARSFGHEVTLFVNPYNIEFRRPYFFHQLNFFLSHTRLDVITFMDRTFKLNTNKEKQRFRRFVKEILRRSPDESEKAEILNVLGESLGVEKNKVADEGNTITKNDVSELLGKGVRIENHGWSHACPNSMTVDRLREEILKSKRWLEREFGIKSNMYAAPFGDTVPKFFERDHLFRFWFTSMDYLNQGFIGKQVYNRWNLEV